MKPKNFSSLLSLRGAKRSAFRLTVDITTSVKRPRVPPINTTTFFSFLLVFWLDISTALPQALMRVFLNEAHTIIKLYARPTTTSKCFVLRRDIHLEWMLQVYLNSCGLIRHLVHTGSGTTLLNDLTGDITSVCIN